MYLIPTTLVHTLFSIPIPTSTFNSMQLFLYLLQWISAHLEQALDRKIKSCA